MSGLYLKRVQLAETLVVCALICTMLLLGSTARAQDNVAIDSAGNINSLLGEYFQRIENLQAEHIAKLGKIDSKLDQALNAYRDENSRRAVELGETNRAAYEELAAQGLTGQDRADAAARIQEEDAKRRGEYAEWRDSTYRELLDQQRAERQMQIDTHNQQLDELLSQRNANLARVAQIDVPLTTDVGSGVQPPEGVESGSPIDDVAGEVGQQSSPIAGEERDRLDAMGDEMTGGEAQSGVAPGTRYEKYYVECPPIRVEVTSDVPPQWDQLFLSFESTGRQARTEVKDAHGDGVIMMMCYYNRSGNLEQPVAPGQQCVALEGGGRFECRKEGALVEASGQIVLEPSHKGDLEPNHLPKPHLWWRTDSATVQYLVPLDGTLLRKVDSEPDWFDCEDATAGQTPDRYSGGAVQQGDYFCYRTHRRRLGFFRVVRDDDNDPRTITLYFVTWVHRDSR